MAKFNTEKRKANVCECILITNATLTGGLYKNGDVRTVIEAIYDTGIRVEEHVGGIYHTEYEVIVETPKKPDRITALETEVAVLKAKVEALEKAGNTTVHNVTINPLINAGISTAETASNIAQAFAKLSSEYAQPRSLTPNERRADVIKRAKAFVNELIRSNQSDHVGYQHETKTVRFHVNNEKLAVTALVYRDYDFALVSKGIAKCDPSDVFNADIGKAIALGRALGVDVTEFERAVQPTEVVVGQRLQSKLFRSNFYDVTRKGNDRAYVDDGDGYFLFSDFPRACSIADDTDAVYE